MKKTNKTYIDIHAIQTVPPSNINRDDTGSPKTAQYGGVTRARVSSQAWKKAMRQYFIEQLDANELGIRTLELVRYIAKNIQLLDENIDEETALKKAEKIINAAGVKTADTKNNSEDNPKHKIVKALFFMGVEQAKALAQAAIDDVTDKKVLAEILNNNPAVDIALFGRMVADDPTLNEDASAQVSHAISTHAVQTEFDFFTATDDLTSIDNSGAGMIGTIEYNSSTLYRYANVAGHELLKQLGNTEQTVKTLSLFIEAFVKSMPTGKVNTFANQTLPQAIVISVRDDRPVNLISGFEVPVVSNKGYVQQSIDKLKSEFIETQKFVDEPLFTLTIGLEDLGEEKASLTDLLKDFDEKIKPLLSEE